jgi:hypothetical protein
MSTTTSIHNKATALTQVQALIAGTQKHFPNGSLTFGNATHTAAELIQALESLANALSALSAAHVRVKDAGTALSGVEVTVGPLMRDYKSFIHTTFATAAQTLADFGLKARKAPTPLTSDQRAVATAKLRATRKARGTTSKKQKLAVKGNVTSVQITPITVAPVISPQSATPAGPPAPLTPGPASTVHASSVTTK